MFVSQMVTVRIPDLTVSEDPWNVSLVVPSWYHQRSSLCVSLVVARAARR